MPKQPKYQEIYNYFRDQIINEYIKPDSPLPQEPEIIQQFSTSHMTINKAMTQLSVDGYIRRVPGTGSFACDDYKKKFQSSQDNLQSINDIIISNGMVPHTVIVSYQVKKGSELPEQSAILNIKPNEYIHEIVRLKYANDRLLCYTVARLSQKILPVIDISKLSGSLDEYVIQAGIKKSYGYTTLQATLPTEEQKQYFDNSNIALMHQTIFWNVDDEPFELSDNYYVGDAFVVRDFSRLLLYENNQ